MNPVVHFTQLDLNEHDVMMLDAYNEVFLWIGRESSERERKMAKEITQEYIAKVPGNRNLDNIHLVEIFSGEETLIFKSCFPEWRAMRRDLAREIEERRKERIQGIEDEAAKPKSQLMVDFFAKLNEKMGVDSNKHIEDDSDSGPRSGRGRRGSNTPSSEGKGTPSTARREEVKKQRDEEDSIGKENDEGKGEAPIETGQNKSDKNCEEEEGNIQDGEANLSSKKRSEDELTTQSIEEKDEKVPLPPVSTSIETKSQDRDALKEEAEDT